MQSLYTIGDRIEEQPNGIDNVLKNHRQTVDLEHEFERLYPMVFKYFRLRGADADTANDLSGVAFEKAIAHLRSYNPAKASLATWLFAIVRNTAINHWKMQRRRPEIGLDVVEERASSSPEPEEAVIQRETRDALLSALNGLDERERDLVALKFSTGLNNRQIAGLTGLTESNVGVILHRALGRVRLEVADG